MNDLVSIITPSYNSSRFISDTIESVLAQSYTNWELLITDDCSTDSTVDIIKSYAKQNHRIKLFIFEQNQGAAASRNNSLKHAKGNYIAFLDSDDTWSPMKIEKQIHFMREHGCAFSFSYYELMDEKGRLLNRVIKTPTSVNYKEYLQNTIIGCLTVMIDQTIVGDFRMPQIRTSQDMATWLQILKRGYIAYAIPEILAQYRLVNDSNSSKKWRAAKDVWKVYRQIEHLSLLFSIYNFGGYTFHALLKRLNFNMK